jgi:hypothetical protein
MGVSIYYEGRLKSRAQLDEFISETEDIIKANDWEYNIIHAEGCGLLPPIDGIILYPPDSESVSFLFNPEGRLVSPLSLAIAERNQKPLDEYAHLIFCKTQFAGVEFHIKLINLLKYLSEKYFGEWDCKDDSNYYQNGDRQKLEKVFGIIDNTIMALNEAFEMHMDKLDPQNPEGIRNFISEVLNVDDVRIVKLDEEE